MILKTRRTVLKLLSASALAACSATVEGDEPVVAAGPTPSETEGPYFPESTNVERDADLTRLEGRSERAAGQVIEVRGRVLGRDGLPVSGARVQLWQANNGGRYAHSLDAANPVPLDPNFQGYGAVQTDADGGFSFTTIKPGGYLVREMNATRTPHLHWKFAANGSELTTQSYFPGEPANDSDFVIRGMSGDVRALIAAAGAPGADGALGFDWTVVMA